jgi:hypothetical protein
VFAKRGAASKLSQETSEMQKLGIRAHVNIPHICCVFVRRRYGFEPRAVGRKDGVMVVVVVVVVVAVAGARVTARGVVEEGMCKLAGIGRQTPASPNPCFRVDRRPDALSRSR